MSNQFAKPIPTPTPVTRPFWDGLNEQQVRLQQCNPCGQWIHYPRSRCPGCLSDDIQWHDVDGIGVVYTFTVTEQPTAPHFSDEVPQKLAVVELPQGVRLTTTLVNVAVSDITVGMAVKPYFDALDADTTLLRYEPV